MSGTGSVFFTQSQFGSTNLFRGIGGETLIETASYPPTVVDGMLLQDWFALGIDKLENAFISTVEKPEILRKLLLAISKPGFETTLSVKLYNRKADILRVSCACAYAIEILHQQGNEYFDFVLLHAPSSCLLEASFFAHDALIDTRMEHKVLQNRSSRAHNSGTKGRQRCYVRSSSRGHGT
jgi:hypothetical protein